jgi:PAT family beta-lactamase induction signal transducer AmpG
MIATASGARRRYSFKDYLNPRVLVMLALGFSSGLPFLLVGNTFGYWLRDEGTSLTAIGFISWVGIAYSLKFLWAPLLDRLDVPGLARLGRRRGWMMLAQLVVGAGLIAMAVSGNQRIERAAQAAQKICIDHIGNHQITGVPVLLDVSLRDHSRVPSLTGC